MGLLHCPFGVPYYDCEGCIDCGMCLATSKEQMIEASKIVREYLQAQSQQHTEREVRKIAVCGKGGVGKSTIITLLASVLAEAKYSVLVIDTDESNPGLSRLFGFNQEPLPLMDLLNMASQGPLSPETQWLQKDRITIDDIPQEYIVENDQYKFLMIGKIEDPFQGCACSMADLTRELVEKLDPGENEILLIDTEAGVESFGRGLERSVDTVLSIVEPSFQSIALAVKIHYMARGMGINRIRTILNKVGSAQSKEKMMDELQKQKIAVLGAVRLDSAVSDAGFEGRALRGESQARDDLKKIVENMLAEGRPLTNEDITG